MRNLFETGERYARKCMEDLIMTCILVLDPIDAHIEYNGVHGPSARLSLRPFSIDRLR